MTTLTQIANILQLTDIKVSKDMPFVDQMGGNWVFYGSSKSYNNACARVNIYMQVGVTFDNSQVRNFRAVVQSAELLK